MSSTDLVRTGEDHRRLRSYHGAYSGELTLYTLGKDLRPWRPIPARLILWSAGLILCVVFVAHTLGISLAMWSTAWFFLYLVIPVGLAWLFSRAEIEGRRLHVVLRSWSRHAFYGSRTVGGCRRARRNRTLRKTRIKVEPIYEVRGPVPLWFTATGVGILAIILVVLVSVPGPGTTVATAARPDASLGRVVASLSPAALGFPRPVRYVATQRKRVARRATARPLSPHRRAVAHHHRKRTR